MANDTRYKWIAMCFILPQILVTLLFFIWPSLSAVVQSLYYSDAFGIHQRFAGLGNFYDLFISADYSQAFWVTLIVAVSVTVLTMGFGLALAAVVNSRSRGRHLYKSLLLWPYAVAPAVAAILWRYLCHPTLGWVTQALKAIGIEFNTLVHAKQALLVVIITASWQQFSYNFLFYYAALKMIPPSILEAAILDGASSWRRFWQISLPLLSPTSFFLLTMNLIYAFFDTFGIIQVMTNGGPGLSTTTLMYKVYKDGFVGMDPGGSSAQSVVLMLVVVSLTLLQFRFLEKRVHYK
jgi:sn-glycerol 3-phosphate transport system permease protein